MDVSPGVTAGSHSTHSRSHHGSAVRLPGRAVRPRSPSPSRSAVRLPRRPSALQTGSQQAGPLTRIPAAPGAPGAPIPSPESLSQAPPALRSGGPQNPQNPRSAHSGRPPYPDAGARVRTRLGACGGRRCGGLHGVRLRGWRARARTLNGPHPSRRRRAGRSPEPRGTLPPHVSWARISCRRPGAHARWRQRVRRDRLPHGARERWVPPSPDAP